MVTRADRHERRDDLRRRIFEVAGLAKTPPSVTIEVAQLLVDLYAELLERDAELDHQEGES